MCAKLQMLGYFLLVLVLKISAQDDKAIKASSIFKPEDCTVFAAQGDDVAVHYVMKLMDGSTIKSSYEDGKPAEFIVGDPSILSGLSYGILQMCVGEKRKIQVPPEHGYGKAGSPPAVPPMAFLDIEVELLHIAKPALNFNWRDRRVMFAGYITGFVFICLIIVCKCLPNLPSQKRKAATKTKKID